jgi:hypothetical protein
VAYIDKVAKQERFLALAYTELTKAQRQAAANPAAAPFRPIGKPRKARGFSEHVKMGLCFSRVHDELEHSREEARLQRSTYSDGILFNFWFRRY